MIHQHDRIQTFDKWVKNKFNIYNSLFLNLPAGKMRNVGILIPLLHEISKHGLEQGQDPGEILDAFFQNHAGIDTESDRIDFMFRVIQYVERQVVVFDSVEDAAFSELRRHSSDLSLQDFMNLLETTNSWQSISEKLNTFSARIVFTAHPTQFYPPPVLDIISKLRELISANDVNNIDLTLQQLGMTSLLNTKKPTPLEEAHNIIYYLRNVYYDAIGDLYTGLKRNIQHYEFNNANLIKLGFWPGGDRDGNPYVTSETTAAVADELRMALMKCYYQDVKDLEGKLTFKHISEMITRLRKLIYPTLYESEKVLAYDDLVQPLIKVRGLLKKNHNGLYLDDLDRLIDKIDIFKTHFATLDIRQNHDIHEQAISAILKQEGIISENLDELEKENLVAILVSRDLLLDVTQYDDSLVKDTINTISKVKHIQSRNGEEGCNRYIISNSEDMFSVLYVFALFRWCGWRKPPVDIIPLFESMVGMKHSGEIMEALLSIPQYRAHLEQRQDKQTVMLGFSDGTKDGGYLKANWSIFKTKEEISSVAESFGIKTIFFDGRGGPPARGGGKTHRFYASQSEQIAKHEIQLTIQGQTITSRYGTKEHFTHNVEQLLTAGLSNSIFEKDTTISTASRELLETLGQLSNEKYEALKRHEMFLPYLENKSTLKYYSEANIGSRPSSRGNSQKLDLKDLRAIPFVGSWSQMKQNVPGYFGIGTALETMVNQGHKDELIKLFKNVPFFKALILNSMMSLFKCYFKLTHYITKDEAYREFWNILHEEYKLSKKMTLEVSGYDILMEEEPISRRSIRIRKRIVLPLLMIQQYALQKIEQSSADVSKYEKIVQRSLYGNINASRNSA